MTEAEQLFEQVYRTYGPSLYRFCLIQMKNPADAEDILQEVFCKRLYRAPVFASPDHERRWLFRVALNQCRDAWKRSRWHVADRVYYLVCAVGLVGQCAILVNSAFALTPIIAIVSIAAIAICCVLGLLRARSPEVTVSTTIWED